MHAETEMGTEGPVGYFCCIKKIAATWFHLVQGHKELAYLSRRMTNEDQIDPCEAAREGPSPPRSSHESTVPCHTCPLGGGWLCWREGNHPAVNVYHQFVQWHAQLRLEEKPYTERLCPLRHLTKWFPFSISRSFTVWESEMYQCSKDGCYWPCVQTFVFVTRTMAMAYRKNTEYVSVEGEREGLF